MSSGSCPSTRTRVASSVIGNRLLSNKKEASDDRLCRSSFYLTWLAYLLARLPCFSHITSKSIAQRRKLGWSCTIIARSLASSFVSCDKAGKLLPSSPERLEPLIVVVVVVSNRRSSFPFVGPFSSKSNGSCNSQDLQKKSSAAQQV